MNSLQNVCNLVGKVVSIPQILEHSVEAVSWDLTMGAAGTALGQMFLEATSSSSEMVPEAMDHTGIIVYGILYEYGDLGVLKTPVAMNEDPKSKYPVFYLRSREKVGETKVMHEEFENWVAQQNATDFRGSQYNVVDHSCVVWARNACQFLQVPHPENWDKICDWALENKKFAGLVGGSGVTSRKVQLKAAAARLPRRCLNATKRICCCGCLSTDNEPDESTAKPAEGTDS